SRRALFSDSTPMYVSQASVSPLMFETALRKLGQRAFDLDEMELEHLVTVFDTDGNGTVELDE
ncbi:unnamed protein product, partial [Ectocarpus sp. 12 AP-2014]